MQARPWSSQNVFRHGRACPGHPRLYCLPSV
ncbi:hypothetical protein [Bradyrhizobium sediminis]